MKITEITEARNLDSNTIQYHDDDSKVVATLKSYDSQSFTKLAQKVQRIEQLESEMKQLKEEVKQSTREDVSDLFDAEDTVKTRVIETLQFIFTLSKDPKATESPKYKDILEELTNHLTPELITVLEGLKQKMVTVTQKAPSLKITPVKESVFGGAFSRLKGLVNRWAGKYDQQLDSLKRQAGLR